MRCVWQRTVRQAPVGDHFDSHARGGIHTLEVLGRVIDAAGRFDLCLDLLAAWDSNSGIGEDTLQCVAATVIQLWWRARSWRE